MHVFCLTVVVVLCLPSAQRLALNDLNDLNYLNDLKDLNDLSNLNLAPGALVECLGVNYQ